MYNQATDEQNLADIQEFLDRAPKVEFSMVVNFNATDEEDPVEFSEERVVEDETDVAISEALAAERESRISLGVAMTGDIPPDLRPGFDDFYKTAFDYLRGERMSKDMLMQPIVVTRIFLEGVKSVGRITDYDVRFDPSHSSHRYAALSYSVAITAANSAWWNDKAKWLLDAFRDFISRPDIVMESGEVLLKWIEQLIKIL